jgi:hypothetical protein
MLCTMDARYRFPLAQGEAASGSARGETESVGRCRGWDEVWLGRSGIGAQALVDSLQDVGHLDFQHGCITGMPAIAARSLVKTLL